MKNACSFFGVSFFVGVLITFSVVSIINADDGNITADVVSVTSISTNAYSVDTEQDKRLAVLEKKILYLERRIKILESFRRPAVEIRKFKYYKPEAYQKL